MLQVSRAIQDLQVLKVTEGRMDLPERKVTQGREELVGCKVKLVSGVFQGPSESLDGRD